MLYLRRFTTNEQGTLGLLFIHGDFLCFTLEDPIRPEKIAGDTCIPSGRYRLIKRTHGRFYRAYKRRWGHEFAIEIEQVPDFTNVLLHSGTTKKDTRGCPLTGNGCDGQTMALSHSRAAYARLYDILRGTDSLPYLTITDPP